MEGRAVPSTFDRAVAGLFAGVIALGTVLLVIALLALSGLLPDQRFDRGEWWISRDMDMGLPRRGMVDDLRSPHLSRGMSRATVVQLLGGAESPRWRPMAVGYRLGCPFDCTWLVVEFDEGGKLRSTFLTQD